MIKELIRDYQLFAREDGEETFKQIIEHYSWQSEGEWNVFICEYTDVVMDLFYFPQFFELLPKTHLMCFIVLASISGKLSLGYILNMYNKTTKFVTIMMLQELLKDVDFNPYIHSEEQVKDFYYDFVEPNFYTIYNSNAMLYNYLKLFNKYIKDKTIIFKRIPMFPLEDIHEYQLWELENIYKDNKDFNSALFTAKVTE